MFVWALLKHKVVTTATISFVAVVAIHAQDFPREDVRSNEAARSTQTSDKALQRQIAFFDFYNESQNSEYKYLETEIGETVYNLARAKYILARVDRSQWQEYFRGVESTASHRTKRDKMQSIGQAIPADAVIYGKFEVTEGKIRISGYVLSILGNEVIREVHKTIPLSGEVSKEIKEFSAELAAGMKEIFMPSDRSAIWRSALLPGWGQFYKGRQKTGKIYAATVGTGFAFSLFSIIMWQNANSRYRNYVPEYVITPQGGTELIEPDLARAEFEAYANQTKTWQTITLVSIGVTFAIYLWQIVDAWIFDSEHAKLGQRITKSDSNLRILVGQRLLDDIPGSLPSQYDARSLSLSVAINY
ncbi:MAG: hypothetical protein KF713_19970 [Turneriella sp.]|nr:hypothetical protein [Turneriella sp.]